MAKFQRKISHIDLVEKHYIFCEGKVTETNYFNNIKKLINKNAINRNAVIVQIIHEDANCDELIRKASIEIKNKGIKNGDIWCVYDKDDFLDDKFDKAEDLAKKLTNKDLKYHAIWSNQCFELWLLLHFDYYCTSNNRKHYFDKLDNIFQNKIGKKYNKSEEKIYDIVNKYGSQDKAVEFAKKLLKEKDGLNPSKINPGTKVYEVIEAISKYVDCKTQ